MVEVANFWLKVLEGYQYYILNNKTKIALF